MEDFRSELQQIDWSRNQHNNIHHHNNNNNNENYTMNNNNYNISNNNNKMNNGSISSSSTNILKHMNNGGMMLMPPSNNKSSTSPNLHNRHSVGHINSLSHFLGRSMDNLHDDGYGKQYQVLFCIFFNDFNFFLMKCLILFESL